MLHQDSGIATYVGGLDPVAGESLSMVAYRSRAMSELSDAALQELVQVSQTRNRFLGLTGVLLYEHGRFFQWLEGPTEPLAQVWDSISRDPRHHRIDVLREEPISQRVFEEWDLRTAGGGKVSIDATVTAMESSNAQLKRLVCHPGSIAGRSLEDVFTTEIIPRLREVHGCNAPNPATLTSTASIWHADADCGERLANALLCAPPAQSRRFVDSLLDQGAGFNGLYKEVFEPAQLQLGKLWDQDLCDDFHLTLGLARLQMEIWRISAALPVENSHKSMHSVLLAAQSHEPHRLGLLMSSQVFERGGWDVMCQAPGNDQALNDLLHTQWFDVLHLSQSGALRRDSRLQSFRVTIDGARAASMNPALSVIVDGRTFVERPQMYKAVHANAMCTSALDAVPNAERLVSTCRSVTPACLVTAS